MRKRLKDRLLIPSKQKSSWLRHIAFGSMYRISDMRSTSSSVSDIQSIIQAMRSLAEDSQISTALSYYATDATIPNSDGRIIWASPRASGDEEVADIVNALIDRWDVKTYARDHILELATIGNLYIPTTDLYKIEDTPSQQSGKVGVMLDNNTITDLDFDIVCSTKVRPESIVHLWYHGDPTGYALDTEDTKYSAYTLLPESSVVHFALGGLLGDYTIEGRLNGADVSYDIQFATPLMQKALQPTQILSLLEDANVLASLNRIIKFINVDCSGAEDDEIRDTLQLIKDSIEQQLSLNTSTGDAQSFINPQSPNNLIYVPKVNGQEAISVTDLNMADSSETDSKLLEYYQNKKLSVLGVPKEAMNFSSNEGLGGAGSVLSQRSAIYANSLQRIKTAYMSGWTDAINKYFRRKNLSACCDRFALHMAPIITEMSTVSAEKRDSAVNQVGQIIDILKSLGIDDPAVYLSAITEILSESLPVTSADAKSWKVNLDGGGESNGF